MGTIMQRETKGGANRITAVIREKRGRVALTMSESFPIR